MKNTEHKIPALRFPEFSDEWEEKKLGEILSIGNGRDYKHLKEGDVPVYGTGGYMTSVDSFLYEGETVCIGRKGTIDSPMFYSGKIWTVDTLFYTYNFVDALPKFIYNIFQNINWKKYNEASGVPSLSKATIEKLDVFIPSVLEQQKIADFLSAVDKRLQLLKDKKTKLEEYKRGVMQRIFSQELRFTRPDGTAYPDWEEKRLGEITEFIRNGLSLTQNNESEGYKVTRIETISDSTINIHKVGYVQTNKDIASYLLMTGDILFSNINSVAHIGKTAFVSEDVTELYHGMNLLCIRVNKNVLPLIVYYNLNTIKMRRYFQRICSQAVNQASINQTELSKTTIYIPSSIDEQRQIADFLSAIDDKISLLSKQIQSTEQYKKGLLQQMFV